MWIAMFCCTERAAAQNDSLEILADSSITDSLQIPVSKAAVDFPVSYKAKDSIYFDLEAKKVYLFGNAVVTYEDMKLEAAYMVIDFSTKDIEAKGMPDSTGKLKGTPIFSDQGKSYEAEEMHYNFERKKGTLSGLVTTEGDGFVYGEKVLRDSQENIYVRHARYTTCNDPHPHFYVAAGKFKIVPGKQVVTGPANLVVADVRTPLLIPFAFFPLQQDRSKGIIFPSYGETQDRGFFLRGLGYYLPINDFIDLTATGEFYFRGSWGIAMRSAYRKRYKYNGEVAISYNDNRFGEPETPSFSRSRDLRVKWIYNQDAKARPGSSFGADVNFVTGSYLRNNANEVQDILTNTVTSTVRYSKSFLNNKLNLNSTARLNQNLGTGIVDLSLPDIGLTMSRIVPFSKPGVRKQFLKNFGFSYSSSLQNRITVRDSNLFRASTLDSMKVGMVHRIPVNTSFKVLKHITVNPGMSYTDYWYMRTIERSYDQENDSLIENTLSGFSRAGAYSASVNFTTIIYGSKSFKRGKIYALRHVMRPQISANFSPDYTMSRRAGFREVQTDSSGNTLRYSIYEQSLMGFPSGTARGGLSFSLGNNLEMKVRSAKDTANGGVKKVKLLEALNFSSSYNFLADSLKLAPLSINGQTALFNGKLRMNFNGLLQPYALDSVNGRLQTVNRFEWNENGKIGRLSQAGLSFNTNLNRDALKSVQQNNRLSEQDRQIINSHPYAFVDFNVPWSLNLNYNLNMRRSGYEKPELVQSVTFQGDVNLSPGWKIGYSSGYDLSSKELMISKIDLYRDLHCWEFTFSWIPNGFRKSFEFIIRAKPGSLQDLKINRRGFWFDQ